MRHPRSHLPLFNPNVLRIARVWNSQIIANWNWIDFVAIAAAANDRKIQKMKPSHVMTLYTSSMERRTNLHALIEFNMSLSAQQLIDGRWMWIFHIWKSLAIKRMAVVRVPIEYCLISFVSSHSNDEKTFQNAEIKDHLCPLHTRGRCYFTTDKQQRHMNLQTISIC